MSLEGNFSPDNPKNIKEAIEKRAELTARLSSFAAENKNPLIFKNLGSSEIFNDIKTGEHSDEDSTLIKYAFDASRSFIEGPIFTDSFHKDHYSRRAWNKQYLHELDPETIRYYESNRLRLNNASSIIGYIKLFEEEVFHDTDVGKQLIEIYQEIPGALKHKKDFIEYSELSDHDKIRTMEQFTVITRRFIMLLENI